jgi:hypothetical protein
MRAIFLLFIVSVGLAFFDCPGGHSQNKSQRRKTSVKTEANNLEVEFTVETPKIKKNDDFRAKAVFTNTGERNLRLNALFLEYAPILIKVRKADGTPVNPTSPPFPPEDDGNVSREILEKGKSVDFSYRGVDLFGMPLEKGKYQVRFRYENTESKNGDWTGLIETGWVEFEVKE